jgi:hypothetical protein
VGFITDRIEQAELVMQTPVNSRGCYPQAYPTAARRRLKTSRERGWK